MWLIDCVGFGFNVFVESDLTKYYRMPVVWEMSWIWLDVVLANGICNFYAPLDSNG